MDGEVEYHWLCPARVRVCGGALLLLQISKGDGDYERISTSAGIYHLQSRPDGG
jgi:hypothetical protein